MSIHIDCHGESHVGRHRSSNEDQFFVADLNKSMRVHQTSLGLNHQTRLFGGSQGKLLLVADGLGGHESGERASTLAVDGVANYVLNAMDWFSRGGSNDDLEFEKGLKEAFEQAQTVLQKEGDAIPQRRGMATTLTMAYIDWPRLCVVHVGDTRCYLSQHDSIVCLTTDHTIGQLTRSATQGSQANPSPDDTRPVNPMDHALWNVIGGPDSSLEPQIARAELKPGDCLLLCSDGLTRYVPDDELLQEINRKESSKTICQRLVETANDRGGKDNITVVLARFCRPSVHEEAESAEACLHDDVVTSDSDSAMKVGT